MPKLCICIISNLLVYQLIAKLLRNVFRNLAVVFRLKNNIHKSLVTSIRLLVDIKQVGKFIDSCCYNFFGIQARIYRNLELICCKLHNRKFNLCHNRTYVFGSPQRPFIDARSVNCNATTSKLEVVGNL